MLSIPFLLLFFILFYCLQLLDVLDHFKSNISSHWIISDLRFHTNLIIAGTGLKFKDATRILFLIHKFVLYLLRVRYPVQPHHRLEISSHYFSTKHPLNIRDRVTTVLLGVRMMCPIGLACF